MLFLLKILRHEMILCEHLLWPLPLQKIVVLAFETNSEFGYRSYFRRQEDDVNHRIL